VDSGPVALLNLPNDCRLSQDAERASCGSDGGSRPLWQGPPSGKASLFLSARTKGLSLGAHQGTITSAQESLRQGVAERFAEMLVPKWTQQDVPIRHALPYDAGALICVMDLGGVDERRGPWLVN
jgi:hypothetical protein